MSEEKTSRHSNRFDNKKTISQIVIFAMLLAISILFKFIAELIPFFNFPNGGNISLVMVPLILIALYLGPIWGVAGGVVFGLLDILIDGGFAYHWLSLILDYFVAFGVIGIAGFFKKAFYEKKLYSLVVSMLIVGILRYLSSFLSGVIVWTSLYSGEGPLQPDFSSESIIYSLTYNGSYMIPTIIVSLLTLIALSNPIFKSIDLPYISVLNKYSGNQVEKNEKISVYVHLALDGLAIVFGVISIFLSSFKISIDVLGPILFSIAIIFTIYALSIWIVNFIKKYRQFKFDYFFILDTVSLILNVVSLILSIIVLNSSGLF